MSNSIWQLKTTPIKNCDEDKLSHDVLATLLKSKTEELFATDDIPSCFCLNGEYGSGKSSIINLYLGKYLGDCNRKIIHFNAWRHKNENIYYALMRNIYYALNNKKEKDFRDPDFIFTLTNNKEITKLDNEFTHLVYANISVKKADQDSITEKLERFVKKKVYKVSSLFSLYILKQVGFFALVIAIIASIISHLSGNDWMATLFIGFGTFLSLFVSAPFILFFFEKNADILPKIVELNILPDETTVNLPNIYNTEHLQCLFRQLVNERKDEKIIIIVEDVDRKDNDEIIKALNDLRTFIDLGEAIFIIPCDIHNIEKAFKDIIVENQLGEDHTNPNIDWRSKDYCTKIFSHIITIPPQNKQDLRRFLLSKIKEVNNHPINRYLDNNKLYDLIDILVTPSIKTPRETINTFNRFTLQLEYAIELENESKRLRKGTITKRILEYARIYMLGNHYCLENELLLNPELPYWIQLLNRDEKDSIPSTSLLRAESIYEKLSDEIKEFISRTEDYYSDLARPFIYLDEMAYSGNIGNEAYNRILASLRNRSILSLSEQLQDETTKKDVNEAITKIISNVSYSTDIKNIIYSLIECYNDLDYGKKAVSKFIIEHFKSIGKKQLYIFNSSTILEIISDSPIVKHSYAKKLYFNIIGEEETSDIISIEKLFELENALLLKLNSEPTFVGKETIDGLKKNLSIPLTDKKEEKIQILGLSNTITELSDGTIKTFINSSILKRIASVIDDSDDVHQDKLTSTLVRLSKELLTKETLTALNPLLGESERGKILYLEICNSLKSELMALNFDTYVKSNIEKYIILEYLKEDILNIDDLNIIDDALKMFGIFDGNYFKIEKKASISFNNIIAKIKENLLSSNQEFIGYNLKAIDIIEDNAGYIFSQNITDSFIQKIKENIVDNTNPSKDNYLLCEIIALHLINKNRIVSIKKENSYKYRDLLIPLLKSEISNNRANTIRTDYIVSFLECICRVETFNEVLIEWLTFHEVTIPENTTQLSAYSSYIRLLEFLLVDLDERTLNNLFNKLFAVVQNSNAIISEPAWTLLEKLSNVYPNNILWINVKERINSFFPHRASYFTLQTTKCILSILNNIEDENIVDALNNQYDNMLLEYLDSDIENSIELLESGWGKISQESRSEVVSKSHSSNNWNVIKRLIEKKSYDFEILAIEFYNKKELDIFDNILEFIGLESANKVISILVDQSLNDITYDSANQLKKYITTYNINVNHLSLESIENIIIDLLKSDFRSKLLALEIAVELKYKIEKSSKVYAEVKNSFIESIDSSTNFEIIQKLNEFLIKLNIKTGIGFQSKIKTNLDDLENIELKDKYKSLIKYGR